MTFTECDTCRAKPGFPALCYGCLANRKLIGELEAALAKLTSEPPTCEAADKKFREWLTQSKHCPCSVHRQMDIADKAAEIFAGVRQPDPPIVRLQFPDGSAPEDLRECAEGWKRHYERMLSDWQTMMQQRDRALRELEREERDHIETIDHRDKHEERINTIVRELGLGEYESSWTSHNDPSERAIEAICELQRQSQQPQPEVIEGRGPALRAAAEGADPLARLKPPVWAKTSGTRERWQTIIGDYDIGMYAAGFWWWKLSTSPECVVVVDDGESRELVIAACVDDYRTRIAAAFEGETK